MSAIASSLTPALSQREREFSEKRISVKLLELQDKLKLQLRESARESFGIELEQIAVEVPPRIELGDLAFPVAFDLAKQIKKQTGEKRPPRTFSSARRAKVGPGPQYPRRKSAPDIPAVRITMA